MGIVFSQMIIQYQLILYEKERKEVYLKKETDFKKK